MNRITDMETGTKHIPGVPAQVGVELDNSPTPAFQEYFA
jgi:hypothetical protein